MMVIVVEVILGSAMRCTKMKERGVDECDVAAINTVVYVQPEALQYPQTDSKGPPSTRIQPPRLSNILSATLSHISQRSIKYS